MSLRRATEGRKTRVAIADDHPVVREGLQRIVNSCEDLEVVGEVSSGHEVEDLCARLRPEVLLLDVSMPGPGFWELLRGLVRMPAMPAILVLSVHPEEAFAARAVELGASGYLNKHLSADALADAIRTVAAGGVFLSESVTRHSRHGTLSRREFQVFLMLGEGMRVSEIASRLGLSPKTVSTHRTRILEKTGFETNSQIVRYVAESGLLD